VIIHSITLKINRVLPAWPAPDRPGRPRRAARRPALDAGRRVAEARQGRGRGTADGGVAGAMRSWRQRAAALQNFGDEGRQSNVAERGIGGWAQGACVEALPPLVEAWVGSGSFDLSACNLSRCFRGRGILLGTKCWCTLLSHLSGGI